MRADTFESISFMLFIDVSLCGSIIKSRLQRGSANGFPAVYTALYSV